MYKPGVPGLDGAGAANAAAAAAAAGAQQFMPQPKFKVIKALGKGSYGVVYKVQRLADGQVYAMKETDMGKMGQQERADAVNEIRLLGSLCHPNVVRHHETFLAGNKLCIVMEYAPAGDLAGFIKAAAASRMPLPEATVWQILLQLCQGMQAVHDTCVIHRDIKPANIFMCPDNVVKVGDLGVAKALTRAHYAQTQIGTPVFMAPEVWKGLPYSYSSDLWSLGCMLYEMLTYRLPFDARSMNELKNKVILAKFPPVTPCQPYSPALVNICHALLNREPKKRPTCAQILNSPEAEPWLNAIPECVRQPLPPLVGPADSPAVLGGRGPAAGGLLPTIRVPRDIRLLPQALPKPSYGDLPDGPSAPAPVAAPRPAAAPAPTAAMPRPAAAPVAGMPPRAAVPAAAGVPARPPVAPSAGAGAGRPEAAPAARAQGPSGGGIRPPSGGARAAAPAPAAGVRPASGAGVRAAAAGSPPAGFRAPGAAPSAAPSAGARPAGGVPSRPNSAGMRAAPGVVPGSHRAMGAAPGVGVKAVPGVAPSGSAIGAYPGAPGGGAAGIHRVPSRNGRAI